MLWAAFTLPVALSLLLSSSATLQLTSDTAETPLESRLDNPNYFEGDLDISQAIIDAYYEQQSGKDVSTSILHSRTLQAQCSLFSFVILLMICITA